MTIDPANIDPIVQAAHRALRAWKRARAGSGAMVGLGLALLAMAGAAVAIEVARGLSTADLPTLAWALLLIPIAAAIGWLRPLPVARAAHELDLRAGLEDRISTALEFAAVDTSIARLQRIDAASVAGVAAAPLFPIPWRRGGPWLLALLLLALVTVGAGLTFDLGRSAPDEVADDLSPAEDLLAAIQTEKETLLERGDKEGARLLDDMAREVRKIQARRQELKRRIAQRKAAEPPPPPVTEEAQLELPPPPSKRQGADGERGNLITAEDLDRLEADMAQGMVMSDAQMGDLTSKLFSGTRAAKKLNEEFHHHVEHELDATMESQNASNYGRGETAAGTMQNKMDGMDMMGQGATSDRLSSQGDVESKGNDMITRDLSAESQAAHDSAHDQQHSFNEFLKDFVKDMQSTVAEAAMGKKAKKKKGREVQTKSSGAMSDKRDAMAESGFEEMEEMKRSSGEAPPESTDGGSGDGDGAGEPGDGPPPDNLDNMQINEGNPGENAIAMKADSGGGKTSAGASGAGTGDPNAEGGSRAGHLEGLAQLSGPLDEVLAKLGEGSLPDDERSQLFERLARHKVQAGLASEADDVLLDYFAQAEELIEEEEQFSPLFRDFATLYFDSIRPGGNRPGNRSAESSTDDAEPSP